MQIVRNIFVILIIIICSAAVLGGLFWADTSFVNQVNSGTEFIIPWKAAQNFMLDGKSPYSVETSRSIQELIATKAQRQSKNLFHVDMPLFILMFFFPLSSIIDLNLARAIWMVVLEIALGIVIIVSLKLNRWKPGLLILIFITIFSVFWLPTINMLQLGSSLILQACLFLLALRSLELGYDELAGFLCAFCLVNLEATALVLIILVVWAVSSHRWRFFNGLIMTLTILIILSLILDYSWMVPFAGSLISKWQNGTQVSTFSLLEYWMPGIGYKLAQILSVTVLALFLLELRAVRGQEVRWLFWTTCLGIAAAPLMGFSYLPAWAVFSLPAVLLIFSVMIQRWRLPGLIGALTVGLVLTGGLWYALVFRHNSIFILFYPVLLTLLLYWIRWGAVRPPKLWVDEINARV
ncbi:MAG: hypothetical protein WCP19_00455 [Chloroflexota bacterium]